MSDADKTACVSELAPSDLTAHAVYSLQMLFRQTQLITASPSQGGLISWAQKAHAWSPRLFFFLIGPLSAISQHCRSVKVRTGLGLNRNYFDIIVYPAMTLLCRLMAEKASSEVKSIGLLVSDKQVSK